MLSKIIVGTMLNVTEENGGGGTERRQVSSGSIRKSDFKYLTN